MFFKYVRKFSQSLSNNQSQDFPDCSQFFNTHKSKEKDLINSSLLIL